MQTITQNSFMSRNVTGIAECQPKRVLDIQCLGRFDESGHLFHQRQ
ncbi:MAG: hypothetical protein PHI06_15270 [Desulfobulbaceae bacterium]|nr:hypothetical protein [Desulfobulbaceae bacterium]